MTIMRNFIALTGFVSTFYGVSAQRTSAYTDQVTGITFQQYHDTITGYGVGIALPETVGQDFIGQLVRTVAPVLKKLSHVILCYSLFH